MSVCVNLFLLCLSCKNYRKIHATSFIFLEYLWFHLRYLLWICVLFIFQQAREWKPCWWIVWRTLEEYEIYSKEQLGSALSLTLRFPKCWLPLSCWWQSKQEGCFPILDLLQRVGCAVICWITQPLLMSSCIVWLTCLGLTFFFPLHMIKIFNCLGKSIVFVSQQYVWLPFLKLL